MIHLTPGGEIAAGTLRLAAPEATVVGFPDALSCGRVTTPRLEALDAWFTERQAFWLGISGDTGDWGDTGEGLDLAAVIGSLREAAGAPDVTLWLGTGTDDQLFAAWFAALVAARETRPTVRVVQFTTVAGPGGRLVDVQSLIVLQVRQLEAPPPARTLADADLLAYAAVWDAWVSGSPEDLVRLSRDRRFDPWMREALASLLDRYPLAGVGVNRWERRVMAHIAAHRPDLVRAMAYTLADSAETADCLGDVWLFWRVRRLADPNLAAPLIELDSLRPELRGRTAALTGAGAAVLAGAANAIDLNGVDDWVGGVHVHGREEVWVRTADGLARYTARRR